MLKSIRYKLLLTLPLLWAATTSHAAWPGRHASQDDDQESVYNLPKTSDLEPINYDYFPNRAYAFVFRNWTVVPVATLARVMGTTEENVNSLAADMGLPAQGKIDPVWQSMKGYITVLRRNWHLLPYSQLTTLLGMTDSQLAWRLRADDFLIQKLGYDKPNNARLSYQAPTSEERKAAQRIARWLKALDDKTPEVPRFSFYQELQQPAAATSSPVANGTSNTTNNGTGLRMAYSYSSEYGDPLLDDQLSSFPEKLLEQLAAKGVNALWIHTVLSSMVPPEQLFPGSEDFAQRLKNLQRLVDRGAKYGIKFYLYSNEPRGVSSSFFNTPERQQVAGVKEGEQQAFCTSDRRTLDWLRRSYRDIFRQVHGLGGLFTITGSENLTFCASHGNESECPRCKNVAYDELVADVNNAILQGVKTGDPKADVIMWDWWWKDDYVERIINRLDKRCRLMSVSEWSLPINRGGIESLVGEYAISAVGPGPRAIAHWTMARKAGLGTVAKVQANTTWELGSFVSIPAMELIARHAQGLSAQHVDGIMLCWSLGGYPTLNLSVFQDAFNDPNFSLDKEAQKYYGTAGPLVRKAWHAFSEGFAEYPYNIRTLYYGPQLVAPSNPFFLTPTGYTSTMVGFPYDDLDGWRAIYPVEVYIGQFKKVVEGFKKGCEYLQQALKKADAETAKQLRVDLVRARGELLHFTSVVNQAEFTHQRNLAANASDKATQQQCAKIMRRCAEDEMAVVKEMLTLTAQDPTIGYEASNQYVYIRQDLREKYINLKSVLEQLK